MKRNRQKISLPDTFKKIVKGSPDAGDDAIRSDLTDIINAAALLQISEFQFFHVAHDQWFGRRTSDSMMEIIFMSYMFDNIVPHWVRQLTRKVLNLNRQGQLDPHQFNIKRRIVTPEQRARGEWYIIMLFMIVVIFCILISDYTPL